MAHYKKLLLSLSLLFIIALAFQNCGEGFKLNPRSVELLSESPRISVIAGPEILTNLRDSTIEFDANINAAKEITEILCSYNGGDFAPCSSPIDYTNLPDGAYSLDIRAIDSSGYITTLNISWTVDATPPSLLVNTSPAAITGNADNQVTFTASDNLSGIQDAECSFQGALYAPCASPIDYLAQAEGNYTLNIRARDVAQNLSAVSSLAWQVDLTAPALMFVATPQAVEMVNTATFQLAATDNNQALTAFECQLDNGGFAACVNPVNYSNLADGQHNFQFRATDLAGNLSAAAAFNWVVDTIPPAVNFVSGPDPETTDTNANLVFSVTDLGSGVQSIECSLDGGAFAACASPQNLVSLDFGDHVFVIRGTDVAGNTSTDTYSWRVFPPFTYTENAQGPVPFNSMSIAADPNGTELYLVDHHQGTLFRIDIATGNRFVVSGPINGLGPELKPLTGFANSRDMVISSDSQFAYIAHTAPAIIEVNLNTGNRRYLSGQGVGLGPLLTSPSNMAMNRAGDKLYAAIQDNPSDSIYEVDIATGDRRLVGSFLDGADIEGLTVSLDDSFLFVGATGGYYTMNIATGVSAQFTDFTAQFHRGTRDLELSPDGSTIYGTGLGGITSTDVATGDFVTLSSRLSGPAWAFNGMSRLTMTPAGGIYSYYSNYGHIFSMAPSGLRTIISNTSIGSGPFLFEPSTVAFSDNGSSLYFANHESRLTSINLLNLARTQTANEQVNSVVDLESIPGTNELLSISTSSRRIVRYDPVAGTNSVLPNESNLSQVLGFDLDAANTNIYFGAAPGILYRTDMITGVDTILSSDTLGAGPNFNTRINDVAVDVPNNIAYVSTLRDLFRVDLLTGDREIILGNSGQENFSAVSIELLPGNTELIASFDNSIVRVNLVTLVVSAISGEGLGSGTEFITPLGLKMSPDGTWIAVADHGLNSVVKVDIATGNREIIAK